MLADWKGIATINTKNKTMFSNGGWAYDAYPELETLDANREITIANIKGPGIITCIHITKHFLGAQGEALTDEERRAITARGIILEVYYNDETVPSVKVPIGDFFADGCGGKAKHFTSLFVELAPQAYNCFIPMPFEKSARVVLRNESPYNYQDYSFVEYEQLPEWDQSLGYFHATWSRLSFQLHSNTNQQFFHVDGTGHLLGRSYSIITNEPFYKYYNFVMEGNNEVRIDGEESPRIDYLGSEDSFAFSWGFQQEFTGLYNGMNYIHFDDETNLNSLSIFRFLGANAIRFNKSLDLRINWSNEFKNAPDAHEKIAESNKNGGAWVDYACTHYWYQQSVGYNHLPMISYEDRCKVQLHESKTE